MWNALQRILPKCGINRRIPRSILYGSPSRQGLGVKDLHLLQGIHHVTDIVDHLYQKSITGHLIRDSLEHLKLELGLNGSIFEKQYEDFKVALLHKSWVRDTWKFASDNNITFNENLPHFEKRRKYDCLLMERLFNHPDIPKQHIKPFNRCRLFLKAISLSDITTGDGSLITNEAWKGHQLTSQSRSYTWPKWNRPNSYHWNIWRKCLGILFTNGSTQRLSQPLGKWYAPLESCNWKWFISSTNTSLYEQRGDQWFIYSRNNEHRRRGRFSCLGRELAAFSPSFATLLPTTVELKHQQYYLQGRMNHHHISQLMPEQTNNNPFNSSTSLLGFSLSTIGNIAQLKESLNNGTALAVSDGSYDPHSHQASAAYTLLDSTGQHGLECSMDVPGRCLMSECISRRSCRTSWCSLPYSSSKLHFRSITW